MGTSDRIARFILDALESADGTAELQRSSLADRFGCVPSQINYVITSRFGSERGYIVESRRGGGGYIRITRMSYNKESYIMHNMHNIGDTLDAATAKSILHSLSQKQAVQANTLKAMAAAVSNQAYAVVPQEKRDQLRASVFKNMLITQL